MFAVKKAIELAFRWKRQLIAAAELKTHYSLGTNCAEQLVDVCGEASVAIGRELDGLHVWRGLVVGQRGGGQDHSRLQDSQESLGDVGWVETVIVEAQDLAKKWYG